MLYFLFKKSIVTSAIRVFGAALAYLLIVSVQRNIDYTQYSIFAMIYSACFFLLYFALFGQHIALIKYITIFKDQSSAVSSYFSLAIIYVIVFSAFCSLGMALFLNNVPNVLGINSTIITISCILFMAFVASEFFAAAVRARGFVFASQIPRDIIWRIVAIIAIATLGRAIYLDASYVLLILAVSIFFSLAFQWKYIHQIGWRKPDIVGKPRQQWLELSFFSWITSFLGPVISQLSVLIASISLSPRETSVYFSIERTSQLISLGLSGINMFIGPTIVDLYSKRRSEELYKVMLITSIISLTLSIIAYIALLLTINYVFGRGFSFQLDEKSLSAFNILCLAQIINASTGPVGQYLQLTGRHRFYMNVLIASNLIGLAILYPLTNEFGTIGAAVTVAVTMLLWNGFAAYRVLADFYGFWKNRSENKHE